MAHILVLLLCCCAALVTRNTCAVPTVVPPPLSAPTAPSRPSLQSSAPLFTRRFAQLGRRCTNAPLVYLPPPLLYFLQPTSYALHCVHDHYSHCCILLHPCRQRIISGARPSCVRHCQPNDTLSASAYMALYNLYRCTYIVSLAYPCPHVTFSTGESHPFPIL